KLLDTSASTRHHAVSRRDVGPSNTQLDEAAMIVFDAVYAAGYSTREVVAGFQFLTSPTRAPMLTP
ncbi:MAG: hypothetical protein ACXV8L_13925, partial [Ilumatobacteraceae bacterium]